MVKGHRQRYLLMGLTMPACNNNSLFVTICNKGCIRVNMQKIGEKPPKSFILDLFIISLPK
ncbi:MAG: hypothetical protein ACI9O0_001209 [Paracoccaceae bacterium]|jgi:hypothetical protein